jgi:hypothetical protein
MKKIPESFIKTMERKHVRLVSEYVNARTHADFECLTCGYRFNKIPHSIGAQKIPCQMCMEEDKRARHRASVKDKFDKRFKELGLDKTFEIVEYPELIKYSTDFIHIPCGKTVHTSLQNLSRIVKTGTSGCQYCSNIYRHTEEDVLDYMRENRPNFTLNKVYMKNHHMFVNITHEKCGNKLDVQYNAFMRGYGCKHCKESGGEEMIAYMLDELGVKYEQEKTFDIPNVGVRRLDFYLPELDIVIEYDGRQHYEPTELWGGMDYLTKVKQKDDQTNKFFQTLSTDLYRIPYYVLNNELKMAVQGIVLNKEQKYKIN